MTLEAALKKRPSKALDAVAPRGGTTPSPDGVRSSWSNPADRKARVDVPVVSFTDFDSVGQVKSALFQLERGMFSLAAQLVDRMFWDDRIKGVTDTRLNSLTALPMVFDGQNSATLQKAWPKMCPEESVKELLKWGLYLGFGLGQLLWQTGDQANFKLKVWHPQFIYWRWDTRSFWVTTMSGPAEVVPGDKQWVLYTPYGYQLGWMQGLVRSLAIPFMCRQWAFRDWARSSEVHGLPIRGLQVPAEAKREDKDRALADLAALGRETVIMLPRASDDDMFDLKLIEASTDSHKTFQQLVEMCNNSIAICLLGQNLTTEVEGGSRAAAQVHDRVRGDLLKSDAKSIGTCLREQAIAPWALLNFGTDLDSAPTATWNADPPEDKKEQSAALQQLTGALATAVSQALPVDIRAVLDEYDVPTVTPAQEAQMKADKAAKDAADAAAKAKGVAPAK